MVDDCVVPPLSEEGRREVSDFIANSVTTRTRNGSKSYWSQWTAFLDSFQSKEICLDYYLSNLRDDTEKALRLALFVKHLYSRGLRDVQIKNVLYIIRRSFECEIQPSGFFDHAIVRRVKAACSRSPAEVRIKHLEDQVKEKLPLPGEAVWRARTHFFIVPTWSAKGMIEKAKWIALAIAFHNGPRASNLTLRDGPSAEDHCIRARDLLFHVDIDDQKIAVHGGEPLRNLLGGDLLKIGKVSNCELTYLTSKSGGSKQILGRSTSCESRVLDDICEWVMFSGVLEADELTTRYPPSNPSGRSGRKVLTKKEFQSVFR